MALKVAIAGKGGVGKTSLAAWFGDWLGRQGEEVWLVDADTALSLGSALGLPRDQIPSPLIADEALVAERVGGQGMIRLNPETADLPERLSAVLGPLRLLVMGTVAGAGGGCACAANSLLKALLAHLILERRQWVIVDLEAGVEHLGRGTVQAVDGLVVVSDASLRGLAAAAEIGRLAQDLGLTRQALVVNRAPGATPPILPELPGLPPLAAIIPELPSLTARQLHTACVLDLDERPALDEICAGILAFLKPAEIPTR